MKEFLLAILPGEILLAKAKAGIAIDPRGDVTPPH